jgi:plasmid stabilization system protein ParE
VERILKKSSLFRGQAHEAALYYKTHAGPKVLENFVSAVEKSLLFIKNNPYACAVYDSGEHPLLQPLHFRRWHVYRFPYWIFFHLQDDATILVDALYNQRQNIAEKLYKPEK